MQQVRDNMAPGYLDTYQMCLVKKGDQRACKVKAITEGADWSKEFALEFSSHPGLAMIKGPDLGGEGSIMLVGEATSDKVMRF